MAKKSTKSFKNTRKNLKRRLQNRSLKNEIRTHFSSFLQALKGQDRNRAEELSRLYMSKLDRAVKSGVVHANNAARHKSKAMRLMNGFSGQKAKEPVKAHA